MFVHFANSLTALSSKSQLMWSNAASNQLFLRLRPFSSSRKAQKHTGIPVKEESQITDKLLAVILAKGR